MQLFYTIRCLRGNSSKTKKGLSPFFISSCIKPDARPVLCFYTISRVSVEIFDISDKATFHIFLLLQLN